MRAFGNNGRAEQLLPYAEREMLIDNLSAFRSAPPHERHQAIVRAREQGLTILTIAAALHISSGRVQSILSR